MRAAPPTPETHLVHEARAGRRPLSARDLWSIPRVGDPVPSPDGQWIAVPVTTYDVERDRGQARIHLMASNGQDTRVLTSEARHAAQPAFSPDGKRLAFVARPTDDTDVPGQLHVLPLDGGEAERLTDLPLGVFDPTWLPDGSGLVCGVWLLEGHLTPGTTREEVARRKERPLRVHRTEARLFRFWDDWLTKGKVPHLCRLDLGTKRLTDLMPGSTLWFPWIEPAGNYDVSPDGTRVVFQGLHVGGPAHRLRADVYACPTDAGSVPECLTADGPASHVRPRFTPDGEDVVYGRTEDPDFYADRPRLRRWHVATDTHHDVLADWDRAPGGWSFGPTGVLYLRAEDEGGARIYRLDPGADEPEPLGDGGTAGAPRPGHDGWIYFTHQTLVAPPEVWRCDPSGYGLSRVTHLTDAALADVAMGEVRSVTFRGGADEPVQMYVVLPPGHADADAPRPLVHMIHGGPHGTFGDQWHARWNAQAFAAPGYAVALVNFHGSTSWGQEFAQGIQGAWGELPAADLHRATDVLVEAGLADAERVAITGGSYGGYLVSWLASTSKRFACAVNHAGVYDLALQYASDVTWGRPKNMGAELWEDPEQVDRWNPVRHAAGLDTPMLVLHGERDFRVPVDQALLCYGILKARGVPARLVYFENENHWILKPQNPLLWYAEVLGWLARFLKEDDA